MQTRPYPSVSAKETTLLAQRAAAPVSHASAGPDTLAPASLGRIFEKTINYIDDKATEQHEYTDQEIVALKTEGYTQEALTQLAAWATSDEGKRS